ncbi:unnamed protein product [Albugo candida]|uniref:Uncharacterized protein n=1 Tax=Albugo candida TaxID=65357 RepID=A0A024GVQ9_9STRA|nr:unnamed protein product [Albugo candida]|eukprot:CCI50470.1 unnamed protein product [Albugo candida]
MDSRTRKDVRLVGKVMLDQEILKQCHRYRIDASIHATNSQIRLERYFLVQLNADDANSEDRWWLAGVDGLKSRKSVPIMICVASSVHGQIANMMNAVIFCYSQRHFVFSDAYAITQNM